MARRSCQKKCCKRMQDGSGVTDREWIGQTTGNRIKDKRSRGGLATALGLATFWAGVSGQRLISAQETLGVVLL